MGKLGSVCENGYVSGDGARTGHSSANHREVRTALSLPAPAVPLGQALIRLFLFFMESNLRSRVAEFEAGYFLPCVCLFVLFCFCFCRPALSPFL